MKILRRYLFINLVWGWLLALGVMAALFGLINLLEELERVGPTYRIGNALFYVASTLPQRLLELGPITMLLGSLLALANMARLSELTILRAAGVSRWQLIKALALPTLVVLLVAMPVMEYAITPLHELGERNRNALRNQGDEMLQSFWSRDDHSYTRVGGLKEDFTPIDIDIYQFDRDGRLVKKVHARTAEVLEDRRWRLKDVSFEIWQADRLVRSKRDSFLVENMWDKEELPRLSLTSDSMPLSVLYRYSQYLSLTGQFDPRFGLAFWKRSLLPVTCFAMLLLAIPLGVQLGSGRSGMGEKLAVGALTGIAFYLLTQMIMALGQIFLIAPWLTNLIPIAIVAAAAGILLVRLRW